MSGSGAPPPRTERVYRGATQDDCLRQALADAPSARTAGYAPTSQAWSQDASGQVLTVTYEQQFAPLFQGSYPVNLRIDRDRTINRLWGIPVIGISVRYLLLIPHFIVLALFGIAIGFSFLVTWIPVLQAGRLPPWAFLLYAGYLRLATRVIGYLVLMAIPYPGLGGGPAEAMDVAIDPTQRVNPAWGIPILGLYARLLCLIPSAIGLALVGFAAGIVSLVTWIPVLLTGRYPAWGYDIVGGYLRWLTRWTAWLVMAVAPYPPFQTAE